MSAPHDRKDDISKDQVRVIRVTKLIDELLWAFPKSSPKEVSRLLTLRLFPSQPVENNHPQIYKQYKNMISVRKSQLNKWRACKDYGRPLKALQVTHRIEWEVEKSLPVELLLRVKAVGSKRRPRVEDAKPVGVWYEIPNRNRQLEYHDDFVSIRVLPQSGTVRVLAAKDFVDYKEFEDRVWDAFLKAELTTKECDSVVQKLRTTDRHKVFKVGPVTPFKIDYYKDSLGLELVADGSHPLHIEAHESWPTWIRPQLHAVGLQTEAITMLTEQIKLHLGVMQGIEKVSLKQAEATDKLVSAEDKLTKSVTRLARLLRLEGVRKKVREERGQKRLTDWDSTVLKEKS
jgi:hypothetical protein